MSAWPWLRTPEATRLIDRLTEESRREDIQRHIAAMNEDAYVRYLRNLWTKDLEATAGAVKNGHPSEERGDPSSPLGDTK